MSKDNQEQEHIKLARSKSAEIQDNACIQILSILAPPIGGIAAVIQSARQIERQQKFEAEVKQRLSAAEQRLDDRAMQESEALEILVSQAVEAASKAVSDSKRTALANALISSITLPTSQFKGKETILRLIVQMSDEERLALAAICKIDNGVASKDERKSRGVAVSEIAQYLEWHEADAVATCEGLFQLGLTLDGMAGTIEYHYHQHRSWVITTLGDRVIRFCMNS